MLRAIPHKGGVALETVATQNFGEVIINNHENTDFTCIFYGNLLQ